MHAPQAIFRTAECAPFPLLSSPFIPIAVSTQICNQVLLLDWKWLSTGTFLSRVLFVGCFISLVWVEGNEEPFVSFLNHITNMCVVLPLSIRRRVNCCRVVVIV